MSSSDTSMVNLQSRSQGDQRTNLAVRIATADDIPTLVDLCRGVGAFTQEEADSVGVDLHDVFAYYQGRDYVFICEQSVSQSDNSTLGFLHISPASITNGTWYVYWIAVARNAQNQGIGRKLMESAEKQIRENGGRLILVETSAKPDFEPARNLYLRMGFKLQAIIPDYFDDGDDKCIFWKHL